MRKKGQLELERAWKAWRLAHGLDDGGPAGRKGWPSECRAAVPPSMARKMRREFAAELREIDALQLAAVEDELREIALLLG